MLCLRFALLFIYFTSSLARPQEPLSLTEEDIVVVEEAITEKNTGTSCDFKSCNGMVIKFKNETGIEFEQGECGSVLKKKEEDEKEEAFCFVNEDSSCEKVSYPLKPGTFASVQPCKDSRAPKPRFVYIGLSTTIFYPPTIVYPFIG